jgi:1,2-phenylacetyl-CoA epoxidase PaaB subunit
MIIITRIYYHQLECLITNTLYGALHFRLQVYCKRSGMCSYWNVQKIDVQSMLPKTHSSERGFVSMDVERRITAVKLHAINCDWTRIASRRSPNRPGS